MLLITLVACRSIQNEGGLDWVTVDFSIAELKQSSAHYAVSSSSIQTAFIIAVPENITSITVSDYLTRYYDRQLQDLTNNSVSLRIPLNTLGQSHQILCPGQHLEQIVVIPPGS